MKCKAVWPWKTRSKYVHSRQDRQRGSILSITAVALVALLAAVGLAVDISHFYSVAAELQNAADAAALAAVSGLNSGPTGITRAVDRAVASMNKYDLNKVGVTIGRENVRFAAALSEFDGGGTGKSEAQASDAAVAKTIRFVQVTVPPKNVSIFFSMVALNASSTSISRRAVAGMSVSLNRICNIAPLSVVQDDITQKPLNPEPGCANNLVFTAGCTYTIRMATGGNGNGNGNGNGGGGSGLTVSAGNYLILALNQGAPGADEVRDNLGLATPRCIKLCDELGVDTEPGVKSGAVRQGLNTRFDIYQGGVSHTQFPPDLNVKEGITYSQYISGSAQHIQTPLHTGLPDRRVMIIPIVNLSEFDQGRNVVKLCRFGAFFIRDSVPNGNGGDIRAEYIGDNIVMGDGGYIADTAGGTYSTSITVPVLYR